MKNALANGELSAKEMILNAIGSGHILLDSPFPREKLQEIVTPSSDLDKAIDALIQTSILRQSSKIPDLWVNSIHPAQASTAAYFRSIEEAALVTSLSSQSEELRGMRAGVLEQGVAELGKAQKPIDFGRVDANFYKELMKGRSAPDIERASVIWRVYLVNNPLSVEQREAVIDHHIRVVAKIRRGDPGHPVPYNPYALSMPRAQRAILL